MATFFAMGKYAAYVWPAYGVTVAAVLIAIVLTRAAWLRAKSQLASLETDKR